MDKLSIVCFLFIFISCSGGLEKKAYIEFVQDYQNGLHVQKETDEFVFDVQYQPTEYIKLMRLSNAKEKSDDEVSNTQYFVLTISVRNGEVDITDYNIQSLEEKQQKVYYFSYQFQGDIQLEENGKLLPCVLFHFERPVDLKHSRKFVLGFENVCKEDCKEAKLVINSSQFGSLPIRIKVLKMNSPALKI